MDMGVLKYHKFEGNELKRARELATHKYITPFKNIELSDRFFTMVDKGREAIDPWFKGKDRKTSVKEEAVENWH